MHMAGKRPQRSGLFRQWRSKLGGGWRLDDENRTNYKARPKKSRLVKYDKPRLVTTAQHAYIRNKRMEDVMRILGAAKVERYM